jgi:hypothetical protein
MAEERTLGLARAEEQTGEEPSKQELQRRLDEARDSISHTVTEIRETVANQVQAVKETLDWREQFKKRPVAWSCGAAGVGFLVGYGLAAMIKGDGESDYDSAISRYGDESRSYEESRSYAAQPILRAGAAASYAEPGAKSGNGKHDEGPGFFERLTNTPAYERVKHEASNVGDALVHELTNTAKTMVLPALMTSLKNFIGGYLPNAETSGSQSKTSGSGIGSSSANMGGQSDRARSGTGSTYQPTLDRNQT